MTTLLDDACAYWQAGGYSVVRRDADFAELQPGGENALQVPLLIWTSDASLSRSDNLKDAEKQERAEREGALLERMTAERARNPSALGYYLVPSRQGLSSTFVQAATKVLGRDGAGGIRVPVEFFDTPYKIEGSKARKARSMLTQVQDLARRQHRVAQPFQLRSGLGEADRQPGDGDLVEYLDRVLRDPTERSHLHLIDGPAGGGKSVAFNALASAVYDEFVEAKRAGLVRRRPIVVLPEHIRGVEIGYVDDIIDAVVEAEIADVVEPEQFHWLLHHGHTLWMFDGLDEIYGGDNDFFEFLARTLAAPGSRAQILICTRDSLTSSSPRMRAFLEEQLAAGHGLTLYELAAWGPDAWRDIAWLELENGRSGARSSSRVEAFVQALTASPELSALARLPFYCSLLIELYRTKGQMPVDRLELLDFVVERMMEREHGKGVFRWRDFISDEVVAEALAIEAETHGITLFDGQDARTAIAAVLDADGRRNLMEILGAIAHQRCRTEGGGEAGALDAGTIRDFFGASYVAPELDSEESDRARLALVQFAFFGAGSRSGLVDFTHPILAEYMAGTYAASILQEKAEAHAAGQLTPAMADTTLRQAVGPKELVAGTVFAEVIGRAAQADQHLRALLGSIGETSSDLALRAAAALLLRLAQR